MLRVDPKTASSIIKGEPVSEFKENVEDTSSEELETDGSMDEEDDQEDLLGSFEEILSIEYWSLIGWWGATKMRHTI